MPGPIDGIRVLDLSRVLAGPWCTQLLADLGADVIKVEKPGTGDETRTWGPPWIERGDSKLAAYCASTNRGKRSIVADLSTDEGRQTVRDLARHADVFIENYRVGTLRRYGLDYDSLSATNPRLIYCSITGFGQTGPLASKPGYDYVVQGMSGLMSVTGIPDGEPGAGPQRVGIPIGDLATGLYAVVGILAALQARERTGRGQAIDLALFDCLLSMLSGHAANFLASGRVPTRTGLAHVNLAPYQAFRTSDGHVIVAVGNDDQFRRLCVALERPWLSKDSKYLTNPDRVSHMKPLAAEIGPVLATRPTKHWLEVFEAEGVPCGPINTVPQALAEAQTQVRGMRIESRHPDLGPIALLGNPLKFSSSTIEYSRAPPTLGEHTAEVTDGRGWAESSGERMQGRQIDAGTGRYT